MNSVLQSALLFIYTVFNRLGFFEKPWIQTLFTTFYFGYKRFLENGFDTLIRTHPELFKNGNIVDVGANIGYTSYLFARVVTPPYKVFAFEPEKRNFRMLNTALRKREVLDRVVTSSRAIGAHASTAELWINRSNDADHRILTHEFSPHVKPEDDKQSIEIVSLDDILVEGEKPLPISFIKVDVQGYEWPVCQGMSTTLERNPNAVIAIEYCPSLLSKLGFDPRNVLNFFMTRRYLSYQLANSQTLAPIDLHPFLEKKKVPYYIDLLFSKHKLL